jgi:hypothetical protein
MRLVNPLSGSNKPILTAVPPISIPAIRIVTLPGMLRMLLGLSPEGLMKKVNPSGES